MAASSDQTIDASMKLVPLDTSSASWKRTLFSFETPLVLLMENVTLSILHYVILFGIFVHVVVNNIIINRGYESAVPITGDLRMGLKRPESLPPVHSLPYCSQYNGTLPAKTQASCRSYTKKDIFIPASVSDFLNVAMFEQYRVCSGCPEIETWTGIRSTFTQGIENYSFNLIHSWYANQRSGGSRDLQGTLVGFDGEKLKTFEVGKRDAIVISDILAAAGVELDDRSDIPDEDLYTNMIDYANVTHDTSYGDTFRHQGLTIFFNIEYIVERDGTMKYEYHVHRLKGTDYSEKYNVRPLDTINYNGSNFTFYGDSKSIIYHGVLRIKFIISGELRQASFAEIMNQLGTGVTLLLITYIVVNLVVGKCLQHEPGYEQAKYWTVQTVQDVFPVNDNVDTCINDINSIELQTSTVAT